MIAPRLAQAGAPVDRVLDALRELDCAPRQSGSRWIARCPAHDDRNPSLGINTGDDGRALLTCYAGCTTEDVARALGLTMRDLFADNQPGRAGERRRNAQHRPVARPKAAASPPQPAEVYPTLDAALASYQLALGAPPSRVWEYHKPDGSVAFVVARFDPESGKKIRPITRAAGGWARAHAAEPRPLYALSELLDEDRQEEPVVVAEGEKCADALRALGFVATTSAGGSNAAHKSDWSPIAGRRVFICPDADASGEKYLADVSALVDALSPPAAVFRVDIPGLRDGEDVFDLIEARRAAGDTDEQIRERILALVDAATPIVAAEPERDDPGATPYRPFPTRLLPDLIADWVEARAASLNLDAGFLGAPLLAAFAGLIGNARAIRLDHQWSEPAALWVGLVAPPGGGKSPALRAVLKPLRAINAQHFADNRAAQEEYARDEAKHREAGGKATDPDAPKPPAWRQLVVDDATREAIGKLLDDNPRGLVVAVDELAGWFGGIDRYRGGRSGAGDSAFWLQCFNGEPATINRRSAAPLHVPHALLSIVGGIQPSVLRGTLGEDRNAESGMLSRFVLVQPPDRVRHWTPSAGPDPRDPGDAALLLWAKRLEKLVPHQDGEPVDLRATPDASALFAEFANRMEDLRHAERSAPVKAALAKSRSIGARLALVWELARWASESPAAEPPKAVSADAMRAGCALAEWALTETLRVYGSVVFRSDEKHDAEPAGSTDDADDGEGAESPPTSAEQTLADLRTLGGAARPTQLLNRWRARYPYSTSARAALDELVSLGLAERRPVAPSRKGGRPTVEYAIVPPPPIASPSAAATPENHAA